MHKRLVIQSEKLAFGYIVRIVEQTNRGLDFSLTGRAWTAPNGVVLESNVSPDASFAAYSDLKGIKRLYVRGSVESADQMAMFIRAGDDLDALVAAVKAYNAAHVSGTGLLLSPYIKVHA